MDGWFYFIFYLYNYETKHSTNNKIFFPKFYNFQLLSKCIYSLVKPKYIIKLDMHVTNQQGTSTAKPSIIELP